MVGARMRFPFEVSPEVVYANPDPYVDAVFSCLESEFLVMPKGSGFVDYPAFEMGYEALKAATSGFAEMVPDKVYAAILSNPIAMIVIRTMLGFTPSEWGYVASQRTGIQVSQGFARSIDRKVRMTSATRWVAGGITGKRVEALVETACALLAEGAPTVGVDQLHRLDKADTRHGAESIRNLANMGAPYAMLLYERFLGRPFAGHRDSVSELVGDVLESAVENVLSREGISYRKTRRAERIEGFDQAPDFIIPSEFNPSDHRGQDHRG
jgi:hypothetical protein